VLDEDECIVFEMQLQVTLGPGAVQCALKLVSVGLPNVIPFDEVVAQRFVLHRALKIC